MWRGWCRLRSIEWCLQRCADEIERDLTRTGARNPVPPTARGERGPVAETFGVGFKRMSNSSPMPWTFCRREASDRVVNETRRGRNVGMGFGGPSAQATGGGVFAAGEAGAANRSLTMNLSEVL